jgi:hypothetical protein
MVQVASDSSIQRFNTYIPMKKTLASLLFAGLLFGQVSSVSAQANSATPTFEGTMTFALQIPMLGEDKLDMKCNVKGEKAMTEMDLGMQGAMHMYVDHATKKMTIVMDAMKMGFTTEIGDEDAMAAGVDDKDFDFKATGKKETVNGYAADEYQVKLDEGSNVDVWLTADAPEDVRRAMRGAMGHMQQKASPKQAKLYKMISDKGLMPVRTVISKGDEKMATIDLVKVEKKNLEDGLFVAPADIKYQPMPKNMEGGMD